MYKKLVLLLTFIVSFIASINIVSAAQELTCIYDGATGTSIKQSPVKFKQFLNGNFEAYSNLVGNTAIDGDWNKINKLKIDFDKTSKVKNNELTACPLCIDFNEGLFSNKIKFNDGPCKNGDGSLLYKWSTADDSKIKNEITQKRTKCEYINKNGNKTVSVYLEYEKDGNYVNITGGQGTPSIGNITVGRIIEKLGSNTDCPAKIYSNYNQDVGNETFSLNSGNSTYEHTGTLNPGETGETTTKEKKTYDEPTNVCTLLGTETIDLINKIMNIIRIIVPILLLIFGVTDFFKAVFSGSSEDMKKDRDRFFKRLIAAVIVFIVPVFVNLVLNLANQVWSDINSETCIK